MESGCHGSRESGLVLRRVCLSFLRSVYSFNALRTDVNSPEDSIDGKKSKDTIRTRKSKKSDSKQFNGRAKKLTVLSKPRPVTLFLGLDDTRTLSSETVPGLSPCWSHFVYVAQSRDVPLDPKDVRLAIFR